MKDETKKGERTRVEKLSCAVSLLFGRQALSMVVRGQWRCVASGGPRSVAV
jgi:hypothetical protein